MRRLGELGAATSAARHRTARPLPTACANPVIRFALRRFDAAGQTTVAIPTISAGGLTIGHGFGAPWW
jgi:hypothetical protein